MLSYLLPRCDRDAPYTVHVGRVAVGVLGGGEVAGTVLQGLSTGCQGKEMIRLPAAAPTFWPLILSPGAFSGPGEWLSRGKSLGWFCPFKIHFLLLFSYLVPGMPCCQGNKASRVKVKLLGRASLCLTSWELLHMAPHPRLFLLPLPLTLRDPQKVGGSAPPHQIRASVWVYNLNTASTWVPPPQKPGCL